MMPADQLMKRNDLLIAVDVGRPDVRRKISQFPGRQGFQDFKKLGVFHAAKIIFPTKL